MLKQKITGSVQEIILPDFPDDDDNTVTTTVTKSRRVSFGPNFVKEFIVDSAISAQCMAEYEQPFPSSDSSNADSSHSAISHGTFVLQENVKIHKSESEATENRPKPPKFASTICFSADSPTADMEFTEGCITLAKSILDKKNKDMTVFIQAKPKGPKEEEKAKEEETNYFEGSQFEMSMTQCVKSKEKKEEKRFGGEKTKIFGKYDDEMSMTRCERFFNDEDEDESKENRMPLDAIMRYLDKDESDSDLFDPEKSFTQLLGVNNSVDLSYESEKLNLNESMEISGDLNIPAGGKPSETPSGDLSEKLGSSEPMRPFGPLSDEKIEHSEGTKIGESPKGGCLDVSENPIRFAEVSSEEMAIEEIVSGRLPAQEMVSEERRSEEEVSVKTVTEEPVSEKMEVEEMVLQMVATEDMASEKMVTEEIASEKMRNEEVASEVMAVEETAAEKTRSEEIAEKKTPERKIAEKKTPEKKIAEKKTPEKMIAEKKTPEKKIAEKKTPEGKIAEKKTPEGKIAEKKTPEKMIAEKKTPEKKIAEKKTPEKMIAEEMASEKVTPEEAAVEQMVSEKAIDEKKGTQGQTLIEEMVTEDIITEKIISGNIEKVPENVPSEKSIPEETEVNKKRTEEMSPEKMVEETLPEDTITDDLTNVGPPWNPPPFTPKPTTALSQGSILLQEDATPREPSLGDLKVIESLREQAREKGCVWSLRDVRHPQERSQGLLSFSCRLLDSTTSLLLSLKTSGEDTLDSCSLVTDSSILLDAEQECRLPEYTLAVGFGFEELKKYIGALQGVTTLRHVPYYMDRVNCFLSKMNAYLRQMHDILRSYPGSRLNGCRLSFRLFSFPIFLSCVVSIDVSNVFRLSKASLLFEHDFGCLDEKKVGEIFEESLKGENSLCEFVVRSTRYLVELERQSGYLSKRRHIRLLPDELKS